MALIGVAAGIGESDDLRLRRLRLQQEGREVVDIDRMTHAAQHLAAIGQHDRRGVALESLAEGIVGSDEEPGVAAGLHHRLAGAIAPASRCRRSSGSCSANTSVPVRSDVAAPETRQHLVLLARQLADRERHAGGRHVDDDVDVVDVEPLPRDVGADVRLVLMIGADDLDLQAVGGGIEILDREPGGDHRAGPADLGEEARHVVRARRS